jgi:hypothetical protein
MAPPTKTGRAVGGARQRSRLSARTAATVGDARVGPLRGHQKLGVDPPDIDKHLVRPGTPSQANAPGMSPRAFGQGPRE